MYYEVSLFRLEETETTPVLPALAPGMVSSNSLEWIFPQTKVISSQAQMSQSVLKDIQQGDSAALQSSILSGTLS